AESSPDAFEGCGRERDCTGELAEVRFWPLAAGEGAGPGQTERRSAAEPFEERVGRLLGEGAVGGELAACHREEAGDVVAGLVVDQLVSSREVVGVLAPFEEGVAHACPGAERPPF